MTDDSGSKVIPFPADSQATSPGLSDEELVLCIRKDQGDTEAPWRELTQRYYAPAWHFAQGRLGDRDLAQDVVQGAFIRVIRALHRFNANKSFAPWFYSILRNLCVDAMRERANRRKMLEKIAENQVLRQSAPPNRGNGDLAQLLAALSPGEREALICRHLHGMTARETGKVLGVSSEAAKKRAQRALEKLRKFVSREEPVHRISGEGTTA